MSMAQTVLIAALLSAAGGTAVAQVASSDCASISRQDVLLFQQETLIKQESLNLREKFERDSWGGRFSAEGEIPGLSIGTKAGAERHTRLDDVTRYAESLDANDRKNIVTMQTSALEAALKEKCLELAAGATRLQAVLSRRANDVAVVSYLWQSARPKFDGKLIVSTEDDSLALRSTVSEQPAEHGQIAVPVGAQSAGSISVRRLGSTTEVASESIVTLAISDENGVSLQQTDVKVAWAAAEAEARIAAADFVSSWLAGRWCNDKPQEADPNANAWQWNVLDRGGGRFVATLESGEEQPEFSVKGVSDLAFTVEAGQELVTYGRLGASCFVLIPRGNGGILRAGTYFRCEQAPEKRCIEPITP